MGSNRPAGARPPRGGIPSLVGGWGARARAYPRPEPVLPRLPAAQPLPPPRIADPTRLNVPPFPGRGEPRASQALQTEHLQCAILIGAAQSRTRSLRRLGPGPTPAAGWPIRPVAPTQPAEPTRNPPPEPTRHLPETRQIAKLTKARNPPRNPPRNPCAATAKLAGPDPRNPRTPPGPIYSYLVGGCGVQPSRGGPTAPRGYP